MCIILAMALLLALAGCNNPKFGSKAQQTESAFDNVSNSQEISAATATGSIADQDVDVQPSLERKITKDVSLVIIVPDVEDAVSRIQEMVEGVDGYIQNANIWQESERMQGTLTLRLPVERLDEILQRLENFGRVVRKNIKGKDVTEEYEEYYDAVARKTTLESQEKRILELINKANTVSEMLEIDNELTRIRSQIESLQTRLKVLDSLTNLATVNIEVQAPKNISIGDTLKEPFGMRIKAGFLRGLNGMVNSVEGLIVLAAILLPYTPIFVIAGYVVYRVWKKRQANN